jgi:hypothetical protein
MEAAAGCIWLWVKAGWKRDEVSMEVVRRCVGIVVAVAGCKGLTA